MNHAWLQKVVTEKAREFGLHVHACDVYRSGSQAGFPDLVIIGLGGVLWRELKVPPDEPNRAQRIVGYTLTASRQDYGIWTPVDWEDGSILTELEGLT